MGEQTRDSRPQLQVTAHSQVGPRRPSDEGGDMLMRLQRDAGNAAVAELLGGGAPPVVAREAAKTGSKPATLSGKKVDAYLIANSVLKPYVAAKMKGGQSLENATKKEAADEFKKAWLAYAVGSQNPKTGQPFTNAEAEAWEPKVNAFFDGAVVHVHETRVDPGTTLHESLHFYSDPGFREAVGYAFNEGATEFLTHKVADANRIDRQYHFFQEYFAVDRVVMVATAQKLAEAYFKNDLSGLATAVNAAHGEGMWDRFMALMQANKPTEASDLIRKVPAKK